MLPTRRERRVWIGKYSRTTTPAGSPQRFREWLLIHVCVVEACGIFLSTEMSVVVICNSTLRSCCVAVVFPVLRVVGE